MDPLTRKLPDPAPVQKPVEQEDCGCKDASQGGNSQPGSGACPTTPYVTGGFTLVARNNTTGGCQLVELDFIQDSQDPILE